MKNILGLMVAAAALNAGLAQASTIQVGTGASTAGVQVDAAAYRSLVDAALTQTVSVASYDNLIAQDILPTGVSSFAFKSTINFGVSAAAAGSWDIRAGVDFGKGGAIFVDGVSQDFRSADMWWNYSYNDPNQFFSLKLNLTEGKHVITLYGLEDCCSGGQQTQFKYGSRDFTSFSASDGLVAAVPEPESYAMFLAGLGLLGGVARRRAGAGA